jgi:hypothetical protein
MLPDTRWATTLHEKQPALAQQVNLWRAAHDVDISDFRPCGAPDHDVAAHQRQVEARVHAAVGGLLGETDRWRPLIDRIAPGLADDPHWPALARAFTRAEEVGFDVEAHLPGLIAQRPLPERYAGRSLDYRLADACPEAFGPIRSRHSESPATPPTPPAPTPDYTRAFGDPSISRGGPRR